MEKEYFARFSYERSAPCVYRNIDELSSVFMYQCKSQAGAVKLADELNSGASVCRGDKKLGTACGKCIKCELVI